MRKCDLELSLLVFVTRACASVILDKKKEKNKKHSENADTSTSVTFDLEF